MTTATKSTGLCDDGLMDIKRACEFLSVSRSKLYRLMDSREIAWTQLGGQRRIPKRGAVAYSEKNLVQALDDS